ncbi:MAG: DNA polymerase IV [Lachnospiraceae bacterium]|nr:DNA polymerase IV [Lachnospiraceae bacterium]
MRYVLHIDVNSAFLAWSAVYRLKELGQKDDLREIPSVVGGDEASRHGIVLAKSTPAKKYGIETAEPIAAARRKCPGLVIVPSDFQTYKKYSNAFIDILRAHTDEVYQYSIDEAWAVFDGFFDSNEQVTAFAYSLKSEIYDKLGFTVNIGVSTKFTLAKIAGDFEKPDKVHTLFEEEVPYKLWPLPVNVILYVGKSMTSSLRKLGILTVKDLYDADPQIISDNLGKFGLSIWESARGADIDPSGWEESEQKGYGNSTTTASNTEDWSTARKILMMLADRVGKRLREDEVYATCISVSARYSDFDHRSRQTTIETPTSSTSDIYDHACLLLGEFWNEDRPIRQLGIRVTKVTSERYEQLSLFDTALTDCDKRIKADRAMDELRARMGKNAVRRGNEI